MAWQMVEGTEKYWFDRTNDGKMDTYLIHKENSDTGNQAIWEVSGTATHQHRSGTDSANFERIIREMGAKPESEGFRGGGASNPIEGGSTDYGAPTLDANDFIDPVTGKNLPYDTVVENLLKKFPKSNPDEIKMLVATEMPKYEGVSEEEKGFVEEGKALETKRIGLAAGKAQDAYGLAVSGAKRGLKGGLGELQAGAGKAGAQMRGAYGGMGGGMRGAIGAQASMAKSLESTYGAYTDKMTGAADQLGYARDTAGIDTAATDLSYRKSMYGLEQDALGKYEDQLSAFTDTEQFVLKKGGRVPSKQTFLDVLSRIPDAKGS
jgi:hypothetical protein